MELFNGLIKETQALLADSTAREFAFDPAKAAPEGSVNDLVLGRDAAYELGGSGLDAVHYTLVTEDAALLPRDCIALYGHDLCDITADTPFARITLLRTDGIEQHGDEAVHAIIRNVEQKKFAAAPKGYMMRASALSNREQVRVSKDALKSGLCFESVGDLLIQKYHENCHVLAVRVIFVTLPDAPYRALDALATKSNSIVSALNHAVADLRMDCKSCSWQSICDEVDGLKEMHQKLASAHGESAQ